jgi:hypothetical protein
MQNFRVIEKRDAQGGFIGWTVLDSQQATQPQIFAPCAIAQTTALLQLDAEATLLQAGVAISSFVQQSPWG